MIRHVVLLEFATGTPKEHLEAVAAALAELPRRVGALRRYEIGRDLGLAETNAHIAVIAEFDDVEGYVRYRDDELHRRIIDEQILPYLERRSAVQFDTATD